MGLSPEQQKQELLLLEAMFELEELKQAVLLQVGYSLVDLLLAVL